MSRDNIRRFLFERLNIRGEIVRLEHSYQTVLDRHPYPPELAQLLGQAMAAVSLLGTTIKYQGKLIMQVQGSGPVNLMVVEYDSESHIRGLIDWQKGLMLDSNISELFGAGNMAITVVPRGHVVPRGSVLSPLEGEHVNPQDKASRYQGIVELMEPSLAGCLEHYFKQSEQLATCLWLVADGSHAAGFMLQQMPGVVIDDDNWQRIKLLAETLSEEELLTLSEEELLHRLFNEDDIRLYESQPIYFYCSCSRQRIEQMLQGLGQEEVNSIIAEQGNIEVACEYCNKSYHFDSVDTMELFVGGDTGFHSNTRH